MIYVRDPDLRQLPNMKRKQVNSISSGHLTKKSREGDDGEGFEFGAHGAKHWVDEEKSKLLKCLVGDGQDEPTCNEELLPTRGESDQMIIVIYLNPELPHRQHLCLRGHL